jgi:dynein heavy chain 1
LRELESGRYIAELNKIQGVEDEELTSTQADKGKTGWLAVVEEKATRLFETLPKEVNQLEKNEVAAKNPIYRFLNRELAVATKLLARVRSDLKKLIEMCKGNIKSTNDLREIAKDLFNDQIPKNWKVYNTINLNVTEWIIDLRNRVLQLNKISAQRDYGKSNIWLGGLIFPEAYLTATRQYVAQAFKVPLDELVLSVILPKRIDAIEETDFVISGVCIEGAEWDYNSSKLIMTDNLYSQLPPVYLRWTPRSSDYSKQFYIPVYLNNMRKNLLFSVMINNEGTGMSDYDWYQRGTALISWNKTYDYKP